MIDAIVPMENDGTKSSVGLVKEAREARTKDITESAKQNV